MNLTLINQFFQANAMAYSYYFQGANLSHLQIFLTRAIEFENAIANIVYYNQLIAELPADQFSALRNIMLLVKNAATDTDTDNDGKFPINRIRRQAAVFGPDASAIVASARSMYTTLINMAKNPAFKISVTDFEKQVDAVYAASHNIPQAPEDTHLVSEFTKAVAGVNAIYVYPQNIDLKLGNLGGRLGEFIFRDSTTPTQQSCIALMNGTLFLGYNTLSKDIQNKLVFIFGINYGQVSGATILTDLTNLPGRINGLPGAKASNTAMLTQFNTTAISTASASTDVENVTTEEPANAATDAPKLKAKL